MTRLAPTAETRRDWLRLARTENVGAVTFEALIQRFGDAATAIEALPELARRGGRARPPNTPTLAAADRDLAAWQQAGQDAGSIVADPRFKDPDHGDFTLAPDSPVWALGFTPLDPAAAGRRTPRSLTATLPEVPTLWPESRSRPR